MTVDVRLHGARGDARQIDDAVMWAGSNHLWSLSAAFSEQDVGRTVEVAGAGQPAAMQTQIASVLASDRVRLLFPAPLSGTSKAFLWRRGLLAEVVHQDNLVFLRAEMPAWTPQDAGRSIDLHLPSGVTRATVSDVVTPWFVRVTDAPELPPRLAVSWDKLVKDAVVRAGQPELSSASAGFHPDIDRFFALLDGVRPSPLVAKIEAVSQKFAKLSQLASSSVTGAACFIGSDDSAAFRSALAPDRPVLVPPGLYLVDGDIVVPDGASIIGRSPRVRPRIRRIRGTSLLDLRGVQKVSVERLHLDGGYTSAARSLILDGRAHPETRRMVRSLTISHCRFVRDPIESSTADRRITALGLDPERCALALCDAEEVVFADNEVDGLMVDLTSSGGARKITAARNHLKSSTPVAIRALTSGANAIEDLVIAENQIQGAADGIRVGGDPAATPPRSAAVRRVSVRSNRIEDVERAIVGVGFGSNEDWVVENNTLLAERGQSGISFAAGARSPFVNLTVRGNRVGGRFQRAAVELTGQRFDGVWVTRNEIAVTGEIGIQIGQSGAMDGYTGVVVADNLVRSRPPGVSVGEGARPGAIRAQSNKLEGPPE